MSKIFKSTHVGKIRKNNEDSLIVIEPETFVVADGCKRFIGRYSEKFFTACPRTLE